MYNRYLFTFIYITLLFTTTYSSKSILSSYDSYDGYSCKYCKNDICVPCNNRIYLGTVIIPNEEGVDVTYITEVCSSKSINLGLCFSKNCTADSECLSNKCFKGHCSFDENNPVVQCQTIRTIHSNPVFGDAKGYKEYCGLPYGYECKTNNECSSHNCEIVRYGLGFCGEPNDDGGCHSACGLGAAIAIMTAIPVYVIIYSILCCCFCSFHKHRIYGKCIKYISIIVVILSPVPWIIVLIDDIDKISDEDGDISGHKYGIIILIIITIIITSLIHFCCKVKESVSDGDSLQMIKVEETGSDDDKLQKVKV